MNQANQNSGNQRSANNGGGGNSSGNGNSGGGNSGGSGNSGVNNNGGGGNNNNTVNNNGGNNANNAQDVAATNKAADTQETAKSAPRVRKETDGTFIRDNPEAFFEQMQAQGWVMQSTEGKDFDVIIEKGDLTFAIKWGSGDSKGAEMFLHGDGEQPIKNGKENPFAGYNSDSDLIVIQNKKAVNGTRCQTWEQQAADIYEVARPFLAQGYDLGISGFSSGGYGACELTEYVMGVKGNNTEPLQEGQQITTRFFDGVPNTQSGKSGETRINNMLAANPENFDVEFYWSSTDGGIAGRTAKAGQDLEKQYADRVKAQGCTYSSTVHEGRSYNRHGYLQFIIPDVLPGVGKD